MKAELTIKGEISTLKLEPGDVLLCRVTGYLTANEAQGLVDVVQAQFPDNKVIVLLASMEFTVAKHGKYKRDGTN